jgi:nucleoside-diphosphate-sugar epimerase
VIRGDGTQTRSFMFTEDRSISIDMIAHCEDLIATPINLGSNELISINELVSLAEEVGSINRSFRNSTPLRRAPWWWSVWGPPSDIWIAEGLPKRQSTNLRGF